jgi:hypothetical protein
MFVAELLAEASTEPKRRPVIVDRFPNECPRCHFTIEPAMVELAPFTHGDWLEIYYRCTNQRCRHLFIAMYERDHSRNIRVGLFSFRLLGVLPKFPAERPFNPNIVKVSPNFPTIFNQARAAESFGLPDAAGPGYRKALEFLLKDYAINLHPNDAEKIKSVQLANVIATYFKAPQMSVVFSRAAWLGNDQTHYERRWIDHDIDNLKRLIDASVHFIEMEMLAAELPADMPQPGKHS